MKGIFISSEDKARKHLYISSLSSFLSKDKKVLIINMEENRELEIFYDIEDFIIYDYLDFFSGNCELDQVIQEIDDNIDLIPSAFKLDKYRLNKKDYKKIYNLKEYDYLIINGDISILENFEEIDCIMDYLPEEELENIHYINNRSSNKKINRKKKEFFEEEKINIIGDMEIDDEIDLEDLYPTWNIYLGEEEFILDRNIFERIFNL